MKKMQKIGATALLALTGICASCGGGGGDPDTAYLTIGTYDGGIGTTWLEKAAERFIEQYGSQTFEEGKTKIKISISANKGYDGSTLTTSGGDKDIYFSEGFDYYSIKNCGKYLDLSDIMTTNNQYGDNKKIIDKIDADYKSYLNIEGSYYGVPFYDAFYGMVYDLDAWKENEFYIGKNGDGDWCDGVDASLLSKGPDNVEGTYDDGLPATFEEYKNLFEHIQKDAGYTPFQYPTNNGIDYMAAFPLNLWANLEGKENIMIGYNFSGTATDLVEVDNDGNFTPLAPTDINTQNGYLVHKQKGLYQTIDFVRKVMAGSPLYYRSATTHTSAQKTFVNSADSSKQEKIAMLCDGSWWENEAKPAFDALPSRVKRHNYAIMPMPFAEPAQGNEVRKQTILSMSGSYGVINTNVRRNGHEKLAKAFMQFLTSDAELQNFTLQTNMTRPLNYSLTEEQMDVVTTYTKSILNVKNNSNIDIAYPYSSFKAVVNDYGNLQTFNWAFHTNSSRNPFASFVKSASYTSKQYFDDVNSYFKTYWETKIIN